MSSVYPFAHARPLRRRCCHQRLDGSRRRIAAPFAPTAIDLSSAQTGQLCHRRRTPRRYAPAASDRLAPSRSATPPAARQRPLRDGENFGGKFHLEPPFTSLDHLVGKREQLIRDLEAERL